ncbi:hypothetical protein [Vibrio aestuarianus]|nr:hypothetical protein [Vibrio aestuarianus]MDE1265479.1 hypothetical protein [Vibrio aestuarianus]MDE1297570.1 hypothetical protein [Vibrio aestuarianus]
MEKWLLEKEPLFMLVIMEDIGFTQSDAKLGSEGANIKSIGWETCLVKK